MFLARRFLSGVIALIFASTLVVMPGSGAGAANAHILYKINLPAGKYAIVYSDGVAQIFTKDRKKVSTRVLLPGPNMAPDATRGVSLAKSDVLRQLLQNPQQPFEQGRVIIVFRDGTGPASDVTAIPKATLIAIRQSLKNRTLSVSQIPQYTNDMATNRLLAQIGTDRVERLFRKVSTSLLSSMRSTAQAKLGHPLLNIAGAYRVHITAASVRGAVAQLLKLPSVAYASADWHVHTMQTGPIQLPAGAIARARGASLTLRSVPSVRRNGRMVNLPASDLPTNYALSASAQSLLNAPSDDAAAAFDEIATKLYQLPGEGEIITDLSLGDLDDIGEASNPSDPCGIYVTAYGPTTVLIGGQRYINWPSMPLIPTYTSDALGNLSGSGSVCQVDPTLDEVGLDFSVMAPLPDAHQRPGEQGSGLTDLLGIAPGASYRLVEPQSNEPTNSDILAALLGSALQTPAPNAITISLGFGEDQYGFSARYFEDDPLAEAIIASLVQQYNIVVSVAAGDGVRLFTTVAIGPNGGSAPTDIAPPGGQITNINDVAFSGVPSEDYDSGSIDAGGTTLDDLFASPPQYSHPALAVQHAYAETRWTGFTSFSSGDGTRVNVAAPSDNILSFEHPYGGTADGVTVVFNGGTSASAPQLAAASAVVLQVARLTGHPLTASQVRSFLESTGTPVPPVPQEAGDTLNIGPQVDLRRAVETLLSNAGKKGTPGVARVAVEQRRNEGNLDGVFESDTDPSDILLQDPSNQNRYQTSWITIAPDWEWLPAGTTYRFYVTGHPGQPIAQTPWARELPQALLSAAGLPIASGSNRTVNFTYDALEGPKTIASATVALTFGPTATTHYGLLAPNVPAVVTGTTIPVKYNLSYIAGQNDPMLVVSEPGRMSPSTGQLFNPVYSVPLTAQVGTVNVPVSALKGGGIYGVDVIYDSVLMRHSDPAFTRVVPVNATASQPTAPLLSSNGSTPGHYLDIPYGSSFAVSYNVSNVPGATGAILEVSAPGPGAWGIYNPFNNPGGSICDNDGVDTGSVYCVPVNGTTGTLTLNGKTIGLVPTLNHVVRVIPVKSGAAAGEAGEVSALTMDGVFASDGGSAENGFGVDQSGLDGYLTSAQETAAGEILSSLETFDQTTNQITKDDASTTGSLYFSEGGSGIFGGDIGLIGLENATNYTATYNLFDTVKDGAIGSAWTPPASVDNFISETAENAVNDIIPMYYYDPNGATNDNYRLFTSDIVKNTFSPIYDISKPIETEGLPNVWGLAENTSTNEAVLPAEDFFADCPAPTLITVDLKSGAVGSFLGIGAGFPYGIAIDSATNKMAIPTLCDGGLTIYNLATQTGHEIPLDGNPSASGNVFEGLYTENDSPNGLFLVEQTVAPDFATNNNSLSRILVYNEAGNLLEKEEKFDLFGGFVTIQAHNLQVDPAHRSGYLIGPGEEELAPFGY
jgi:hypothetical protein